MSNQPEQPGLDPLPEMQALDDHLRLAHEAGVTPQEAQLELYEPEPTKNKTLDANATVNVFKEAIDHFTGLDKPDQGDIVSNNAHSAGQALYGAGHGVEKFFNASADLVDMGVQAIKPGVSKMFGTDTETLDYYAPWFWKEVPGGRDNMLFKDDPEGFAGVGSSLVTQYAASFYTGQRILSALPGVATGLKAIGSGLGLGAAAAVEGTAAGTLAEGIGFQSDQGNLTDFLNNVGLLNSDLGRGFHEYLGTEGKADGPEGRLKNMLANVAGDTLAGFIFAAAKMSRALKSGDQVAIQEAAQEAAHADDALRGHTEQPVEAPPPSMAAEEAPLKPAENEPTATPVPEAATVPDPSASLDELSVPATGKTDTKDVMADVPPSDPVPTPGKGRMPKDPKVKEDQMKAAIEQFRNRLWHGEELGTHAVFDDINLDVNAPLADVHEAFRKVFDGKTLIDRTGKSSKETIEKVFNSYFPELEKVARDMGTSSYEVLLRSSNGSSTDLDRALLNAYSLAATEIHYKNQAARAVAGTSGPIVPGSDAYEAGADAIKKAAQAERLRQEIFSKSGRILQSTQNLEKVVEAKLGDKPYGITRKQMIEQDYKSGKPVSEIVATNYDTIEPEQIAEMLTLLRQTQDDANRSSFLSKAFATLRETGRLTQGTIGEVYFQTMLGSVNTLKMAADGSGSMFGLYKVSDILGAGILDLSRVGSGKIDFERTQRAIDQFLGVGRMLPDALTGAARIGLTRDPQVYAEHMKRFVGYYREPFITAENFGVRSKMMAPLVDAFGGAVRLPERGLSTVDSFFTILGDRAFLHAEVQAEARRSGLKVGTPEYKAFVSSRFNDTNAALINQRMGELDPRKADTLAPLQAGLSRRAGQVNLNQGWDEGETALFTTGQALDNFLSTVPGLRAVASPFTKVYINMLQGSLDMTPATLLFGRNRDALMGKLGPLEQERATGTLAAGLALGATGYGLFQSNTIQIAVPGPTNQANIAAATGRGGRGITWEEDGHKYEASIEFLGPGADILTYMGYLSKVANFATQQEFELANGYLIAMLQEFSGSQRFMAGINKVFTVMADDNIKGSRKVEALAQSSIPNLVPGSRAAEDIQHTLDPHLRKGTELLDGIKTRIPGLAGSVNTVVDTFGEDREDPKYVNLHDLNDWTKPSMVRTAVELGLASRIHEVANDPVAQELNKFAERGMTIPQIPRNLPVGKNGANTTLDLAGFKNDQGETAHHYYQRQVGQVDFGGKKTVRDFLNEEVSKDGYKKLSPPGTENLGGVTTKYNGNQWGFISRTMQIARERAKTQLRAGSAQFKNAQGQTLEETWSAAEGAAGRFETKNSME